MAVERGLTDLRLYFMLGLPGEEDSDVEAIARLAEKTRRAAQAARPGGRGPARVTVNASIYVPKPGTPLAESPTPPAAAIKRRIRDLAARLGRLEGIGFRAPSLAAAEAQRLLSWGDRSTLDFLLDTARHNRSWRQALARADRHWAKTLELSETHERG
jgi:radical SAM superfamily enzyme YgiQ (UPF0313 family)